MAKRDWLGIALLGAAMTLGATAAEARRTVIDAGLNPNIMLFGNELPSGSNCDATQCEILLPFRVDVGGGFTRKIYLYNSGIASVGAPLPPDAFSSSPVDGDGNPVSVPQFFAASGYHVLAPGYRPDDAGTPANAAGGITGIATTATVRSFAQGSIDFCSPDPAPPGQTVCPAGYEPFVSDPAAFIDPFITDNGLDRFVGTINLTVGLQHIVFYKPVGGFVEVEFFQSDGFGEQTDDIFVGLSNNLELKSIFDAEDNTFSYRFAVASVPEPASWALLIAGFGLTGGVARRRRQAAVGA